ncbi:Hsp20/alpha crystallin family protein [Megalodesulfovibrio gigas]|uniref:Putative heat shock protein n=1 Tax=Megalodesulfovibrio gigas (strain ATCC 19364 / DSM 1382 / NCIMB 9332 / VKM B-1759) TaxID=1121448 RepID=T2GDM4_MEGG1|nr:Hsp20/alpha crystallin family protein [Megalodesulfovibrio gigas]AGW14408.1 putative heat shock protein [Megalodesulfovibrio gigas DSM 1382 = ATCC 19364]
MFRTFVPDVQRRRVSLGDPRRPGGMTSMADLANLLEDFWKTPLDGLPFARMTEGGVTPAMNLREMPDALEVTAELPGVAASDIEVTIDKGILTIKGEKKFEEETQEGAFHRVERSYGSFSRSVSLPSPVAEDKIAANFANGVLTLTLPKAEEAKARKIEITS